MSRIPMALVSIGAFALAGPVAAQEFTGSITMTMTSPAMGEADVTFYVAGARQVMVMKMPESAGPLAGMDMRMVVNTTTHQITTLIPMPPGSPMPGKGMKQVTKFSDEPGTDGDDADVKISPLGTKQTIAGMSCDDYQVTTKDQSLKMCVTDKLGHYRFPELSGRAPKAPSWTKAFGGKAAFPLKLWQDDGKMSMTVTKVTRGDVPAPILDENPEGYTTMPGMGG